MGITTGNLASALRHILLVSCIPITFSHTKYSGVHANPNVMNCFSDMLVHRSYNAYSIRLYFGKQGCKMIDLMDEHEYNGRVTPAGFWEESERVGVG